MTSKIDEISKTDEDFFVTRITAKNGTGFTFNILNYRVNNIDGYESIL